MEKFHTYTKSRGNITIPPCTHHSATTNLESYSILFHFSPLPTPQRRHTHTHTSLGVNLKENLRHHIILFINT